MSELPPPAAFDAACETIGLELEAAEREQLGAYLHLLLETNKQFNLTAIKEPGEAWLRHVLDSLSLLPHLGQSDSESHTLRVVDVGSGGGLPGVPLAITRPDVRFTLVEATGKKAKFLQGCADELGLSNLEVVNDRAETIGRDKAHRQRYDVSVARAVGPMNVLLELTMPLVRVGGRVLAMKGRRLEEELRDAGDALMLLGEGQIEVYEALPGVSEDALIVEVAKHALTPKQYPRRPGEPKTNPL